jgi:hypothetical protein
LGGKETMDLPEDPTLPFVAYGVFRKGELAYLSIADLVETTDSAIRLRGSLYIRDGLPVLDVDSTGTVPATLIQFSPTKIREAYERINRFEPDKQYMWRVVDVEGARCNCLVGRSPRKGSVLADEGWNGREDPLFTSALRVIDETLQDNGIFEWDLRPMFRLQMAYMLLWSVIERYASLRYHLGDKASDKVKQIADEPAFAKSLSTHVNRKSRPRVQRADRPSKHYSLDSSKPKESLNYYYQIRSNITHRGKGVVRDHDIIRESLRELLAIFTDMLETAFNQAQR